MSQDGLYWEDVPYNLRNRSDITGTNIQNTLYFSSFFPHTIRDWNKLTIEIRQKPSIDSFKSAIQKTSNVVKYKYFSYSIGRAGIHHSNAYGN